jgi:hypothetical protein
MPDLRAGLPAPARGDEVGLPGGLRAPPWRIEKSFRVQTRPAGPTGLAPQTRIDRSPLHSCSPLAVSHWIEHQTGWSIKKFVRTARRYRTVKIQAGQQIFTVKIQAGQQIFTAEPLRRADQLVRKVLSRDGNPRGCSRRVQCGRSASELKEISRSSCVQTAALPSDRPGS